MKRFFAVLLVSALLLGCFAFPGFAEEADRTSPVVLIEEDLCANKGVTQALLSNGTSFSEDQDALESGEGSYLVYKVTAPATQGVKFQMDFKACDNGENGGVHLYTVQPKYQCFVTTKELAEDFAGDVTGWTEIKANEKVAEDKYSYTYTVDGASGYEEETTVYVCFKFASNDASCEGQEGWNNSALIEKITAATVPYTGIMIYDGSDNSAWETGELDNETLREEDSDTPAVCYDFSVPSGKIGPEEVMATLNLDAIGQSYDVSEMDFIVFDIYVTDKMAVANTEFCLELTSSGTSDDMEHEYVGKFGGLGDGWNTVVVRLGSFQYKDMDLSSFNYFRLYNTSAIDAKNDFVFKIDNIRFEQAAKLESDYDGPVEEHIFFVLDEESESEYMINCTAQNSGTAFRFCDTTSEVVYKFDIVNRYAVDKVVFTAMFSQQLLLQVSQDGSSWTTVYEYDYDPDGVPHQGLEREIMEFDLTSFVDLATNPEIYIRIADAYPSNGWGGTIHSDVATVLAVQYTELTPEEWDEFESSDDDRSMSFMTCSKPFGAFTPNTDTKTAGYSSLMLRATADSVNATTLGPIDSTGYDSLEFDLYLDDVKMIKAAFADTGIELSSAGVCDDGELGWSFADLLATNEVKSGWNHITLLFRDGKPDSNNKTDFDPTAINFFRIYFVGMPEEFHGFYFGIDNVRLTKAAAELDAEQARLDQEAADDVIEKIEKIGEVTEKSSSKINRAKKAYEKLTDAQKALVTNYATLEEAIAKYEELTNPTPPACTEHVDADNDGKCDDCDADVEQNPDDQKPDDQNPDDQTPDDQKPGTTTPKDEGGCASVMTLGVASIVLLAGACMALVARKKED